MKSLAVLSTTFAAASAAAVAGASSQRVSYDGTKVFRVSVGDEVDRVNGVINKLQLNTWKGVPRAGALADIVVPPEQVDEFNAEISGLNVTTMHEDLGLSIADESSFSVYAVGSANTTWFNSYHAYADHLQFLKDLVASYPNNAEIVTSGSSLQGNTITGIHIYGSSKGTKPAVVFHGTVHAREWIGTMTNEYIAYNLLTKYSTDTEVKGFVEKYDFYVFPVVNPDGFIYTQTTNRLWRKNRQTTSGSSCLGHDINRNWPYQWSVTGGASTDPCAEDFKGASAGDAPETAALSAWLSKTKAAQGLKLFIDFHSYSQLFMTPYGYSCTAVSSKNTELQSLAKGAVAAIKAVHGTSYQYGPICTTIYKATGSSVDYVNDVVKADYTFTQELRDTGNYGFVLPASQIVPTGEETYAGVRYLLQNMK
ncbi:Metallocarboxypeptidase A-like protein [Colletotrichum fructicola]|uniref:Metallocarboxypeptidase A-like protein n=1 Tax=Colletotrichum fructicola (strain Nara gc5) TaxID=1213859 RepID=A0A7J6IS61_COLFN|nr:Metallocarboxypeptidase A-like protein [Colletotrichum fructicola]KAF4479548.1 Metallocarboxypeptidase A-like protein [Colletotrichum fructicola Nara gc5]KAE9580392.1 Metallocarboxypeptidase A-like protein [Colletotrichum fructicola]KAF4422840.1 Metallocarboxypeptidase A-like protein [Colletotrichum fructicola]KAF4896039.1 Metallocarboxypeptidase A-like protein [Colletotrichum fructicola]KAF4900839.1 Metallocarboxypeptidase A-like protein [Colletotrichum fructicola]